MENKELIIYDTNGTSDLKTYTTHITEQLKAQKIPDAEIDGFLKTLDKIAEPFKIKTPEEIPTEIKSLIDYSKTQPEKTFAEILSSYAKEKFNSTTKDDSKITELSAQVKALEHIIEAHNTTEINKITDEIKTYDTTFDANKFLEGFEGSEIRRKTLEHYLTTLKKHAKPIHLELSPAEKESTVTSAVEEMFGKNFDLEARLGLKK